MEITGKIVKLLPLQSGEGRNGTWKKQEFILEIPGQYPKSICMHLWGDAIDAAQIKENEEVIASFDIESREYNGKWYTNVKAWKIARPMAQAAAPVAAQPAAPQATSWPTPGDEVKTESAAEDFDDLPF